MKTITDAPNINMLWAHLIIEECVRLGVTQFCLAPGSRSAPLALAVAAHKQAQILVHIDERGLGFYALGLAAAKTSGVALITTSGTAVANLMPAVVEASKKKLPLLILTADRPAELRHTGAHQTIDQIKIFGNYVQAYIDMPCPSIDIMPSVVLTTIDHMVAQSQRQLRGPVHLNCPFREPLAPIKTGQKFKKYLVPLKHWMKTQVPFTSYALPALGIDAVSMKTITEAFNKINRGLIIVGKLADPKEAQAVLQLAEHLQWPVFPDVTSGLRLGTSHPLVISNFDQILRWSKMVAKAEPQAILHLGGRMTSKTCMMFIERLRPIVYIMALNHPLRSDPHHLVTHRLHVKVHLFCHALVKRIAKRKSHSSLKVWQKAQKRVAGALCAFFDAQENISEPLAARLITQMIPKNQALFMANSMSLREIDMFGVCDGATVPVSANRGASGIDGTIASAVGFSAGLDKPLTLLIGDLAFLHDLNSLMLVATSIQPIIIVLLNNQGGGIFSFLPVAKSGGRHFEPMLAAPPINCDVASAAAMFHIDYARLTTVQQFKQAYQGAINNGQSIIIEIPSDRAENFKLHQRLQWRCSIDE